ncbi:helix-turn-helix domain-containing protein [Caldalkalibacillus thermarum]|uniref:helix-turn-helix domain-containing protein n=1 Tax=Caldalkalibacillus thermarum TaxID=296745 RepID=UPI003530B016
MWGRRIRAFRKLKGYTQKELADALHVSVSVLGAVERGNKAPSPEFLAEIAKVLDVDVKELKGDIDHDQLERGDNDGL